MELRPARLRADGDHRDPGVAGDLHIPGTRAPQANRLAADDDVLGVASGSYRDEPTRRRRGERLADARPRPLGAAVAVRSCVARVDVFGGGVDRDVAPLPTGAWRNLAARRLARHRHEP